MFPAPDLVEVFVLPEFRSLESRADLHTLFGERVEEGIVDELLAAARADVALAACARADRAARAELPALVHEVLQRGGRLEDDQQVAPLDARLDACARLRHFHVRLLLGPAVEGDALAAGSPDG